MAVASSVAPILRIKRSTQSGPKTMTGAYAVVYFESSTLSWRFEGAVIDLSDMLAGDVVDIRIRKILAAHGAWIIIDELKYEDAQPVTHPSIYIPGLADFYGLEISMRQTAGALLTISAEFFDAKMIGLP